VWRTPKEAYIPDCLVPTVRRGGGSVTIWAAICWYSAGPISTLKGRFTTSSYEGILGNQVRPVIQMLFRNKDVIFQGVTSKSTQS
jgi:hypothetical protein